MTTEEQGQGEIVHEPTFALLLAWQVHEEAARQTAENRIIEVEWPVGRSNNDDIVLGGLQTIHLLHELGYDAPVRDTTAGVSGYARAEECIQFVNEDDTW